MKFYYGAAITERALRDSGAGDRAKEVLDLWLDYNTGDDKPKFVESSFVVKDDEGEGDVVVCTAGDYPIPEGDHACIVLESPQTAKWDRAMSLRWGAFMVIIHMQLGLAVEALPRFGVIAVRGES